MNKINHARIQHDTNEAVVSSRLRALHHIAVGITAVLIAVALWLIFNGGM